MDRRDFIVTGMAAVVASVTPFKPVQSATIFVGLDTALTPDLTVLHEFLWDNSTGKWCLATKTETLPLKEVT